MTPRRPERGSGLLSSLIGIGCVAAVLGLAVNLTLGLWTRSTVDAVAYDVARDVASTPDGVDRSAAAERATDRARAALGSYGERVQLRVETATDEVVVVHVRAPGVELLPAMLGGGATVGTLDRRIVVRSEGR